MVYVGRLLVCAFSTLCTSVLGLVMAQVFFFLRCSFSVAWLCSVCPSSCSISVCVSVLLLVAFFAALCLLVEAVSGFVVHFCFLVCVLSYSFLSPSIQFLQCRRMVSFQFVWYWSSWQSDQLLSFGKMEEAICRSVGCCTETWRRSTSRYSGGVCVLYVCRCRFFSVACLVYRWSGACSEEMTDNQGQL